MSTVVIAQVRDALSRHGIVPRALRSDSCKVNPGDLFVALPGERTDGSRYIGSAIEAGACAVLCEAGSAPSNAGVPVIEVQSLRSHAGAIADALLDHPSSSLHVIGVTGTNGKTSVTHWIAQAMQALGTGCGVIGTLGSGLPGQLAESPNTTPDVVSIHQTLADLRDAGARACAMEVSSIGLDQGRIDAVRIHTAVFTNLTRDHLDYHADMQSYAAAKSALFSHRGVVAAVINTDDLTGRALVKQFASQLAVIACEFERDAPPAPSVLSAENPDLAQGVAFDLELDGSSVRVDTALVGQFNVQNLLAVAGSLLHAGIPMADIARALGTLTPPPGRMQRLGGDNEPLVVVDYAHTPDALEQALLALRPVAEARGGNLACVFGCGGDRDVGKRPMMGAIASLLAPQVWITSDNPRSEDPEAILDDIEYGVSAGSVICRVTDRATAIRGAIMSAEAADVVLLAGKGHETYQEQNGQRSPWSDVEQAQAALRERETSA